jgi:plastocyanin
MIRAQASAALLVLTALVSCGDDSTDPNQPPGGEPLPPNGISIVAGAQTKASGAFAPNPLSISLADGGTVRWFNNDGAGGVYGGSGVVHNITADDGSFASGSLAPGASFQTTLTTSGEHGYHCSLHPAMQGSVTVTP